MKIKALALIALISLISACGFQLRGNFQLADSIAPVYISNDSGSELGTALRRLLSSNTALTDSAAEANHKLVLLKQDQDRRNLSIGDDANAVEYQLIETVVFAIENKQGQVLVGPKTLTERRIMRNDPDQVVSKGEEEVLLRREMKQSLASKIIRQLSMLGQSQ